VPRSVLPIGCILISLVLPPSAMAGGWWTSIRLGRETVAVNQHLKAHANVMFSSVDAVEAAQRGRGEQEFYVYLLRGFDYSVVERAMRKPSPRNWWSIGGARAFQVGRVVIGGGQSNLALANASFRVPDLPPGRYAVMFCDAGCAHPLADVIPTAWNQLTVVADPATARLAARVERLERLAARGTRELARSRAAAWEAQAEAALARSETEQLEARLQAVARSAESAEGSPWAYGGWLFGGAALGALFGLALRSRRRATETSPDTVVLAARPRSSSRDGRSRSRRRRSGGTSSPRA
jgi:hypothetical protein